MNSAVVASLLTAILVSAAGFVLVQGLFEPRTASAPGASAAASAAEERAAIAAAALEEKMAALLARLDALEARLAQREEARLEAGAADPSASDTARAQAEPQEPSAPVEAAVPSAAAFEGEGEASQRFREAVLALIAEDRENERTRTREEAERRRKEWEEMNRGPYGRFNYKVNSLAKELELDDAQKAYYHELLVRTTADLDAARKQVNWQDAASREAFQTRQKELQQGLDDALVAGLTAEQAEEYRALPEWQRRIDAWGVSVAPAQASWTAPATVQFGGGATGVIVGGEAPRSQ